VAIEEPGGDVLPLTRKRPPVAKPKPAAEPEPEPVAIRDEPQPLPMPDDDQPETTSEAPAAAEDVAESQAATTEPPESGRKGRRKRASVPSWDDIVFGARKDD